MLQLFSLYTRIDGFSALVGIFFVFTGLFVRSRLSRKSTAPLESDSRGRRFKASDKVVYDNFDFAACGSAMLVIEAVAIALYLFFGLHLPVAPGG